jgi:hypothetical protein
MFAHTVCLRDARAAEGVGLYKGVGIEKYQDPQQCVCCEFRERFQGLRRTGKSFSALRSRLQSLKRSPR